MTHRALSASSLAARALLSAFVLTLLACSAGGRSLGGGDPFAGGDGGAQQIRLRIRNANFYDATVTAIGDNTRRRLGVVGGNATAVFTLPWEFSSGLRVQVDLLAGPSCTTDTLLVNPGDEVEFQIPPDLGSSTFCS